jgi:DnaJ-class molecular chaperone
MPTTEHHSIKIFCHSCRGRGHISESSYPDGKAVQVVCPECDGKKYVTALSEIVK